MFQQSQTCPTPIADPDLVVQVVDQGWLPLPGVDVAIEREDSGGQLQGQTDIGGEARFRLRRGSGVKYRITIDAPGFRKVVKRHVWFGTQEPTPISARMQLMLEVKE
jgi:flavin-dependent dehydrogenase